MPGHWDCPSDLPLPGATWIPLQTCDCSSLNAGKTIRSPNKTGPSQSGQLEPYNCSQPGSKLDKVADGYLNHERDYQWQSEWHSSQVEAKGSRSTWQRNSGQSPSATARARERQKPQPMPSPVVVVVHSQFAVTFRIPKRPKASLPKSSSSGDILTH